LIAAATGGTGTLMCTDSNEKRLPRLLGNLERLHISHASAEVHDWTRPAPAAWHGRFDGILLDVPCSNTGVIRRRVDVRWRLQAPDIAKIAATQSRILEHALPCLKPGGRIVYSTCSIEPEENLQQVEAFVARHPDCQITATHAALPFQDQTDGAFAARIERISES
jgi:16S rRNA (cytosine967-C5)-methyltransferase